MCPPHFRLVGDARPHIPQFPFAHHDFNPDRRLRERLSVVLMWVTNHYYAKFTYGWNEQTLLKRLRPDISYES